jgi:hypothetical protein
MIGSSPTSRTAQFGISNSPTSNQLC